MNIDRGNTDSPLMEVINLQDFSITSSLCRIFQMKCFLRVFLFCKFLIFDFLKSSCIFTLSIIPRHVAKTS